MIFETARSFIGTPFRHQGRLPGIGLDCAGVVCVTLDRLGIAYNQMTGYPRTPYAGMLERVMDDQPNAVRVPVSEIRPGDILLMRFTGDPQHLAIYAGETIIHAYEAAGKCCEHDLTPEWRRRIVSAYRVTP